MINAPTDHRGQLKMHKTTTEAVALVNALRSSVAQVMMWISVWRRHYMRSCRG